MQRPADIRSYFVRTYSDLTLGVMLNQAKTILAFIDSSESLLIDNPMSNPRFFDTSKRIGFESKGQNKFGVVDSELNFTTINLRSFVDELSIMVEIMGMKNNFFYEIPVINFTEEILPLFKENISDICGITADVYSTLIRRYQNKTRTGSTNNCAIKFGVSGEQTTSTIFIKNIVFGDEWIDYNISSDYKKLQNVLKGDTRYYLPTAKNAWAKISQGMGLTTIGNDQSQPKMTFSDLVNKMYLQTDSGSPYSLQVLAAGVDKGIMTIVGLGSGMVPPKSLIAVQVNGYRIEFVDVKRKRSETTFTIRLYSGTTLLDITRKIYLTDMLSTMKLGPAYDLVKSNVEGKPIRDYFHDIDHEMSEEMMSALASTLYGTSLANESLPLTIPVNADIEIVIRNSSSGSEFYSVSVLKNSEIHVSPYDYHISDFIVHMNNIKQKEEKPISFWKSMFVRLFG